MSMADQSLYLESHWETLMPTANYPMSRSRHKLNKILATARTYEQAEFEQFSKQRFAAKQVMELCLFDTFVEEDFDWFKLYE